LFVAGIYVWRCGGRDPSNPCPTLAKSGRGCGWREKERRRKSPEHKRMALARINISEVNWLFTIPVIVDLCHFPSNLLAILHRICCLFLIINRF
jgi:hypothetical protein